MAEFSPPSAGGVFWAEFERMTTDKRRQVVEDDLRALEEAHQLELEKKVELERTVDNQRQQLRSLSALHSAEARHKQVLQSEIQELRRLLQPNGVPQPASAAVEQAANAQAVAEARAQAAEAQMMALEEAMRISRAENERQLAEIQHLQTERRRAAAVRLAAQEERDELERSLRDAQQAAEAQLADNTLLRDKYAASRERMELVQEQLLGAQQQLAAQSAEAHTQAAGGVAQQVQRVGEAAESSSMRLEEVFSKAANSTDPSVSRGLPMRKEESLETMDLAPACSARFDLVRRKRRTARTAFLALLTWVFVRCSMLVRWCWVVACFFRRRSK